MPSSSSSLLIISKCTVYPETKSTLKSLKLSISDLPMLSCQYIQKGVLLSQPPFETTFLLSLLKQSLSKTLSHFPPLAGRFHTDEEGYIYVLCNDAGVDFYHAQAPHLSVVSLLATPHLDLPQSFREFFQFDGTLNYAGKDRSTFIFEEYGHNLEDVTSLLERKAHRDINILLPPPDPEDVIQVTKAITSLEQTKTAWVGGKFRLIPNQTKFCYTACINCNKSLNADSTWSINCPSCKEETVVHLRSNLGVHFMDNASSLEATIYSPDVEKLIPYTTETLQEVDDTDTLVQNNVATALPNKNVVCYMKYYDRMVKGEMVRKYPILKVYNHAEVYGETSEATHKVPNTNPPEEGNPISPQSSDTLTNLNPLQQEPTPFRSTPITITENISAAVTKTTISANPSHTKRTLQFTETVVSKEKDSSVSNITTRMGMESAVAPSASTTSESPIKKNKNKVKQA